MASQDEVATAHGGLLAARRLRAQGVDTVFTLSGGHLFSIYDGCRAEGIALVDTRHEATAAFAAEGWAKVTRRPGVAALTAGPGVTNGMSAMGSALQSHSPMLVLGGRAPAWRWGQGSLQEIDHLPFVRPLARFAATAESPGRSRRSSTRRSPPRCAPPAGRRSSTSRSTTCSPRARRRRAGRCCRAARAAASPTPTSWGARSRCCAEAERPVVMAGSDLWWGHGEDALLELVESLGVPVFLNGLARGCVPADHRLASRACARPR